MFHQSYNLTRDPVAPPDPTAALRLFVQDHSEALQHAAALLGGPSGRRLAERILDDLGRPLALHRATRGALLRLLDLLALEHVGHPDRDETAYFAQIDPADPRVSELCLLADQLRDVLTASGLT